MTSIKTEADLCLLAEEYLRSMHFEVYKEVAMHGNVCDLVAKLGPMVWCVECKMTAGLSVLEQASKWKFFCHRVSVCVPKLPKDGGHFFHHCARQFGIGCLSARRDWGSEELTIREDVEPAFWRKPCALPVLREEQKSSVAGLPAPERVTAFTLTVKQIKALLAKHPEGLPMKDVIANIEHHYQRDSTARACMYQWVRRGILKGVVMEDGRLRLAEDGVA